MSPLTSYDDMVNSQWCCYHFLNWSNGFLHCGKPINPMSSSIVLCANSNCSLLYVLLHWIKHIKGTVHLGKHRWHHHHILGLNPRAGQCNCIGGILHAHFLFIHAAWGLQIFRQIGAAGASVKVEQTGTVMTTGDIRAMWKCQKVETIIHSSHSCQTQYSTNTLNMEPWKRFNT